MTKRLFAIFAILPLLGAAVPSRAWEDKGHNIISRVAAEAMPVDTPAFFRNAAANLEYLGPEPDRIKRESGPQLAAVNSPDHFMDTELVPRGPLPIDRYKFIAAVATQRPVGKKRVPADEIGFLPYRIAEQTQTLQSEWRDWKNAKAADRPQIEQNIIHTAGILGHFVADAANPHHSTVHYNGWDEAFAPNPNGYTTSAVEKDLRNGFHRRFEKNFVEFAVQIKDIKPLIRPVRPVISILDDSMGFLRASNGQVKTLYELEKKGAFKTSGTPDEEGLRFVRERMAAGASMLRDIWVYAMAGTVRSRPVTRTNAGN